MMTLEPSIFSFCHCPLPFSNLPGLQTQHTQDSLRAIEHRLAAVSQRIDDLKTSHQLNIPIDDLLDIHIELSTIKALLDGPSGEQQALLAGSSTSSPS